MTLFFNIFDSFFWTLGPILAESYKDLHPFNGLFLTVYTLPFIFIGWFVGPITRKFGKKRTAFASFFIGSFFLSFFFLFHNPYLILGDIFLSSVFIGFTIPAIDGAYADYINETPKVEKEIEALNDFSTNLGYFIGPILAGLLADLVGHAQTFSVLGFMCFGVALILFVSSPRKIKVNI